MKLKIAHLYPDLLNLYGDSGNILCLEKRMKWRGIDCNVYRLNTIPVTTLVPTTIRVLARFLSVLKLISNIGILNS